MCHIKLLHRVSTLLLLFVVATSSDEHGQVSRGDRWSMVVSIQYDCRHDMNPNTHCCIGTILTESYVLTAADCVDTLPGNITVVVGSDHRSALQSVIRNVDQFHIHPKWIEHRSQGMYNIALLHLSKPLSLITRNHLTWIRRRIQFQASVNPPKNRQLTAVGWSSTASDGKQQTEVHLLDNNDPLCSGLLSNAEQQFCARSLGESQDLCDYQPGQPLFQWIENGWMQIGMISSIAKQVDGTCLRVFTRLISYDQWTASIVDVHSPRGFHLSRETAPTESLRTIYSCDVYTASCGCSEQNVNMSSPKIIGGEEAVPYSWGMVVSVHFHDSDEPSCTGSILTKSYILTSARCVDGVSEMDLHIVAGVHDRIEDFPIVRYVQSVHVHPHWNRSDGTYRNDIALLYIFPPLSISGSGLPARTCAPHISPASETVNYPSNGSHLVMVGWGATQAGSNVLSNTLQQASLYVMDGNNPDCSQTIHDVNTQFCAANSGRDPCHGDLGGPIFQWKGIYWDQVGITSYGGRCDHAGSPGVYTRLAPYFDWLESVTMESLTTTTPMPPPVPIIHQCDPNSTCGCGRTDVVLSPARIVGGEDAVDDSWPMIVSLRLHGSSDHSCGGTILSKSYILTAAHCLRDISEEHPSGVTIATGMTNRSDPLQIIRRVDRVYMHPLYLNVSNDNRHDIALLHIDQPLEVDSHSKFAKTCIHRLDPSVPTDRYPENGTRLAVIGWGILRSGTAYVPEILQQTQVFSIDNQDPICLNTIQNTELQFCAGLHEGGKDSCKGDSGGPIFQWTGRYWDQVGIVSYGKGCAEVESPGVYTRLSYYYTWIQEILSRDGEHLEPIVPTSTTTVTPDTSTGSPLHSTAMTSYYVYKYPLHLITCGLVLLSCLL